MAEPVAPHYVTPHLPFVESAIKGLALATAGVDEADFLRFAAAFLRRVDERFIVRRGLPDLIATILDLYRFVQVRPGREISVRVFNPAPEANGYSLDRTVVETAMPDQPFLFDSMKMLLGDRGLDIGSAMHPIVTVRRGASGRVEAVGDVAAGQARESLMHLEIDRIDEPGAREALRLAALDRLRRAQAVVDDFSSMRDQCLYLAGNLPEVARGGRPGEVEVARDLFRWLTDENFVFMGYKEFVVDRSGPEAAAVPQPTTRQGKFRVEPPGAEIPLPSAARSWLQGGGLLFVGKGDRDSDVHRPGRLDLVAARIARGEQERILLFAGLFTRRAIRQPASRVPMLREKVRTLLAREDAVEPSYLQRTILDAINSMPMEYLLQASVDEIGHALHLVHEAEERRRTVVHPMIGPDRTTAYVLVSFPREHYDEDLRLAIRSRLEELTGATYCDDRVATGEHDNAVIQFFLTAPAGMRGMNEEGIRRDLLELARTWEDRFTDAVRALGVPGLTDEALAAYLGELPEEYRHQVGPDEAALDLVAVLDLRRTGRIQFRMTPIAGDDSPSTRLRIFSARDIFLSHSLPVLSHFGLRVIDHNSFGLGAGPSPFYLDSFRVQSIDGQTDVSQHEARLAEAMRAVFEETTRDDRLARLVLTAHLTWQEVAVLRGVIHYARQLGHVRILEAVRQTWIDHPQAAELLMEMFRSKFDPDLDTDAGVRDARVGAARRRLQEYLGTVDSAAEDRTLRHGLHIVDAMVRTNAYSTGLTPGHPLSFKVDCAAIPDMPSPRPFREIFVYDAEVMGVHLRGGPVARGGLRWSDRPEDFRTEVLGLMATQQTKNVLIVPVGAKGGFVLRKHYDTPQAARKAADELYKLFIRGLLDLTDNIVDGDVVPPARVVRYDGDDPYLVVAADKGTAHLSDTANAVAAEYGFWLGDAFASGGSRGYDHKDLAITARGAWVCVRRHFHEMGTDPERDTITAVGIGDMSGDVFGNGLLLSRTVRLVAAFNHMHIFVDPDPDPERSWVERKRLFDVPRSTWADYDRGVLSPGGGIYPRHAKRIELSEQARRILGVEAESLSGEEAIRAILEAEVDLLWNGGIGTYVKASWETDRQADDATNDAVRVDARDVRARVVGEGGNLGFTQSARVEYAQKGGRINTDAVDNSGGVDTSDHEVNLKILFSGLIRQGLLGQEERDGILRAVVGKVCDDVLANNYLHSELISVDQVRSQRRLEDFSHMMAVLQAEDGVDLRAHRLPDEAEMQRRRAAKEGMLRPELAKLSPFTKMRVYGQLVDDPVFDGHYLLRALREYFPPEVRGPFAADVDRHLLRRQIAATVVTNRIIDAAGCTFFQEVQEATSRSVAEVALAYLAAADLMGTAEFRKDIHSLDGRTRASVQYRALIEVEDAAAELTRWLLVRGMPVHDAAVLLDRFQPSFDTFARVAGEVLPLADRREIDRREKWFTGREFPAAMARRLARVPFLPQAGDVVLLAERAGTPVEDAAVLWYEAGESSRLQWALQLADASAASDGWERIALLGIQDQLRALLLQLSTEIAASRRGGETFKGAVRRWFAEREDVVRRLDSLAERIDATKARGLAPATVVASTLTALAR